MMMKKLLLLLVATFVATVTFTSSASAATISFSNPGIVSGPFDLVVTATDLFAGRGRDVSTDAIVSYGFTIVTGNQISFDGATSGPLFDPVTSVPGLTVFASASGLGIFPGTPEPLVLATLHFSVVSPGLSFISITSNLNNAFAGLQYLNAPVAERIFAQVNANVVPEPATLVLSLSGLIGLAAARTRARA